MRVLLVDDDAALRALLRATLDVFDVEIDEAENADVAQGLLANGPDAIVLDVAMPGAVDGIEFCRRLKSNGPTSEIPVVLLTGSVERRDESTADAVMIKPFSPLELLGVVERLVGGLYGVPFRAVKATEDEQLLLYARDLRHLLELERTQRSTLESAYRETVTALANAVEAKDSSTRAHSQRVRRYALVLASLSAPELLETSGAEYGFLLHDVGKIGIPDHVLQKPGPLSSAERSLMQTHTVLGAQMLGDVAFLRDGCIDVVRSHHERWDGGGYPDGLRGDEIPLGARVFAVADALDAMTTNRPYRSALSWEDAVAQILPESGKQFDPGVVAAFCNRESTLRQIHGALLAA